MRGSGWQQANFSSPVPITAGTTYIASYLAPTGHYAYDANFFANSGVDNAPLHALASGVDGRNGVFAYNFTSSFPVPAVSPQITGLMLSTSPREQRDASHNDVTTSPASWRGVPNYLGHQRDFQHANGPYISHLQYVSAVRSWQQPDPRGGFVLELDDECDVSAKRQPWLSDDVHSGQCGAPFETSSATTWEATLPGRSRRRARCPVRCALARSGSSTTMPGVQDSGESRHVELGVKFQADLDGYITGIRFYKSTANTGTHIGNIWTTSGVLLGSVTFTGESASGWQQATFASPVQVNAGTTYVASYFTSTGHYAFDQNYFSADVDNVPLHALSNASGGGNGVYVYTAGSAFPNLSYNSSNYWVDVVYVPRNSSTAPVITCTTPGNGTTGASLGGAITARFSEPMDPSTITADAFQVGRRFQQYGSWNGELRTRDRIAGVPAEYEPDTGDPLHGDGAQFCAR